MFELMIAELGCLLADALPPDFMHTYDNYSIPITYLLTITLSPLCVLFSGLVYTQLNTCLP